MPAFEPEEDILNIHGNIHYSNIVKSLTSAYDKFTAESHGERILKIGQHLAKLSARVECPVYLYF